MEDGAAALVVIGGRVRREAQGGGGALDRLAELSGVSRCTAVNAGQGAASPGPRTRAGAP